MMISINDQIHLTEIRETDQSACIEYLNDIDIYKQTLRIPFPYTETSFRQFLTAVEQVTGQQGRPVQWAIRTAEDRLIGSIGFEGFQLGKSYRAEIGYWLGRPFWRRGIMTAVIRHMCEFGFAEFGLVKIIANVFPDNTASARLLEKCGFVQEGYLRCHYLKEGKPQDALLFALLKPSN